MITRVQIKGYKSLQDVNVDLKQLTVLIGANAAGKSNFLDALQLLSRIANAKKLKDAFESPHRGTPLESFSFRGEGIRELLQREHPTLSIEVDVKLSSDVIRSVNNQIEAMQRSPEGARGHHGESSDGNTDRKIKVREDYLRYRIEITIQPKTGILQVSDEFVAALNKDGTLTKKRKPFLESKGDNLRLRLEGQGHPRYLGRYVNHSALSVGLYAPYYPHMVALKEELSRWFFYYFEPRERMRTPNPVKEVRHIGLMGEELASFLNTLKATEPKQFDNVVRSIKRVIPSITDINVNINDIGQVELEVVEGDTSIPARLVSEGTLRLLGLLSLSGVKEPASVLGFEEPENGVQPGRIDLIAKYLTSQTSSSNTQFIVTTHSPVLADKIPPESLYMCQKRNGVTSVLPLSKVSMGPLAAEMSIQEALKENPDRSISTLMLRGDLDA